MLNGNFSNALCPPCGPAKEKCEKSYRIILLLWWGIFLPNFAQIWTLSFFANIWPWLLLTLCVLDVFWMLTENPCQNFQIVISLSDSYWIIKWLRDIWCKNAWKIQISSQKIDNWCSCALFFLIPWGFNENKGLLFNTKGYCSI